MPCTMLSVNFNIFFTVYFNIFFTIMIELESKIMGDLSFDSSKICNLFECELETESVLR
jgi:hypothetical protein